MGKTRSDQGRRGERVGTGGRLNGLDRGDEV